MAILTIDDILHHEFPRTKFKEGFDPDAVDAFLDRVIESMVLLQEENTELKSKLEAAERRLDEVGDGGMPVATPVSAPVDVEPHTPAEPASATSMLALAQRVHDEYVRDGREEGDRIIAESREQAKDIVRKAETERDGVLENLAQQRDELEGTIEGLKTFERDYRSQVRSHLESLLGNLEQGPQN
ncbi:DivIVA domain-containing protein [Boudabousia marimammalium]|uniref:Cell wall synthesis protein Wag31 n=1 Tax=Boudabousia marimammalium TaxID=156892 RepID=A0A1Q5PNY9_9ACTO|nr:DivIVA domain-containing protein [Boudabousia marimammalium]OKL49237.1 hypothetical protein BM477_04400 [Boudabousia marimammalium]